ncbi:hypothetical protein BDZ89DRAFT_1136197 [Hymenopellis radicata]|nr:hypothetical protein BDZ89DRAFT_1136197 [Hymenopellis radicata]
MTFFPDHIMKPLPSVPLCIDSSGSCIPQCAHGLVGRGRGVLFQELGGGGAVVGGWDHQHEIQHRKKTKPQSNLKRHQNPPLVYTALLLTSAAGQQRDEPSAEQQHDYTDGEAVIMLAFHGAGLSKRQGFDSPSVY